MGIQLFDSNNDPVISADPIGSPDQQVADITGNIINPAKEDGNLLSTKTNTDNLDVLLSSRSSEVTLASLEAKDFATEVTLGEIKTQTDSLTFDTGRLVIDGSQVTQPIQGVDAVGGAVTETPITIAGEDDGGVKRSFRVDDAGRVLTRNEGVISTSNSTTTPLGAGSTFTGDFVEVLNFSAVVVALFSDQDSATDGLVVEYSTDGVNVDNVDTYTITGGSTGGQVFTFGPTTRFIRVSYTNGSVAQTTFRLQTLLKSFSVKSSTHRIGDLISSENDAELGISVIKAQNNLGQFDNISATSLLNQNHLAVVAANILLEQVVLNHVYSTSTDFNLPSAGTEIPALLVRNPAGSGKAFHFSRLFLDILTKGNQCTWRLYVQPTVTGTGTAITVASTHIGGGAPTSVIQVFSGPSVSSNGTKALTLSTGTNTSTSPIPFDLGIIIEPGFDALLTGNPSGNNTNTAITASWVEV